MRVSWPPGGGIGDLGPQTVTVGARGVLVPPLFRDVAGRAPVFVDEDRGQFTDFLARHLTQGNAPR
jgi:hypothetical protein